jgi:hypothetical protein
LVMEVTQMTGDAKRLLVLIDRFSEPAHTRDERETWIKKIPLAALINRGVRSGTFETFDTAPTLVDYKGTTRFANISKEGEDDVADLREMGLVERLKLATSHHIYVSAYRITPAGKDVVKDVGKEHVAAIDQLLACKSCNGRVDIVARDDSPYLVCPACGAEEKVALFDIAEVSYVSRPVFTSIWLPPD